MLKSSIKIVVLLVGLSLLGPPVGMAKRSIDWRTYDEGVALSRQEGKKLFIHFFADW